MSLLNKCDFYLKEIKQLRNENQELHGNFTDLLKENSVLIQIQKKFNKVSYDLSIPFNLMLSDGKIVKETYIEGLIKENSRLRAIIKETNNSEKIIEVKKNINPRFERKRDRKGEIKQKEELNEKIIKEPAKLKEKALQNRKSELEREIIELKKSQAHDRDQYELELNSFKLRLESTSKNYQILQEQLQMQKQM